MTGDRRLPRRGVLALAGSAALAGCGGLAGSGGGDGPTVDAGALRAAVAGEWPTLPATLPVGVAQSHVDAGVARARRLLDAVPAPLGPDEIPNGAIRRELRRFRAQATDALDDVPAAASPLEAAESAADARRHARALAAAWQAIDADLARADLRDAAASVRGDLDAFRGEWRYAGPAPVDAVLVHAEIESWVRRADVHLDRVTDAARTRDNPVALGETAGLVEAARAAVADARHVRGRYLDAVDDPRRLQSTFEAARQTLADRAADRRRALPDGDPGEPSSFVDREIDGTPAAAALSAIAYDAGVGLDPGDWAVGWPATRVLSTHRTLANLDAFETLLDRVRAGNHAAVSGVHGVRSLRADAHVALASTADDDAGLDRQILAGLANVARHADRRLASYDGDVPVALLDDQLGRFVEVAAVANATPPASDAVAAAVRSSG